jgi:cobalamin biosynthesis Mg chelatase CobN
MTRAELHDDLARLETLVDEYALAADLDPKRATVLAEDILSLARAQRLDADVNVTRETPTNEALRALDAHLCDLKEMQIRDGLHVFGRVARRCSTQRPYRLDRAATALGFEGPGCFVASGPCARSRPWRISIR